MSKNRKLTEFFISSATLRAKRPLPADDDQASVKDCSDVWRISPSATRKEVEAISRPPAVATHDSIQTHHSSTLVAIMDPSGDPQPSLPNPSHVNPALSTVQTNSCKDRKRMMKDGEVVIRSSDDEDSASDSSLVDVDNLLIAQRPTLKPSLLKGAADDIIPPLDRLANPKSIRITSRKPAKPRQPTSSSPMPLMPKYKYSLDSLVNQAERDTASEVDVERARSRIESSDCAGGEPTGSGQANFVVASTGSTSDQLDESLLASVIPASGEGAAFSKVLQAMKRTEALHRGKIWAFFSSGQPRSICDLRPFPVHAFPLPGWQDLLKDTPSRQQMFLSGHFEELVTKVTIPDQILVWILHSAYMEPREDLRYSYLRLLKYADDQIQRLLEISFIDELFRGLGARPEATDVHHPVILGPAQPKEQDEEDWTCLVSVLTMLTNVSPSLSTEAREHAIYLVARLTLDSAAIKHFDVSRGVQEALASLMCSIPDMELEASLVRMSRVIFHFTVDTQLRLLLVSNLPAHSPALHLLRCRLALAFFFDDPSCLCNVAPSLVVVINRLSEPPFQIREGMDFAQLAAQISMVDIGVDHVISSTSAYTEQREATFNRDVDSLATRVKTMFTSIIDSGASHMTRTEAKEVLEALHYRLMYAVRTKIKPKLSLFGSANPSKYNEDQKVGSFMINFLSKGRSNDESGCR